MSRNKARKPRTPPPTANIPAKAKHWTTPVVLGIALSAVGAVSIVELWPELEASPKAELSKDQPFSAPFEISNVGYLKVHVKNVIAVLHKAEVDGGISIRDASGGRTAWENFDLGRGEGKTIVANFGSFRPDKADLVISVDYSSMAFITRRQLFRFEGLHADNWQWTKQPVGDIRTQINRSVDQELEFVRYNRRSYQH